MATHAKEQNPNRPGLSRSSGGNYHARETQDPSSATQTVLQRSGEFIQQRDYVSAAELLRSAGHDLQVRNLLGICLMRIGEYEQAVQVFRQVVLAPGGIQLRTDIDNCWKRNFATALLLKGLPSGALEVLAEIPDDVDSLRTAQIRSAIVKWEKTLSLFRWLDWKLNKIEPRNCRVPIDFEPGELDFDGVLPRPNLPSRSNISLAA